MNIKQEKDDLDSESEKMDTNSEEGNAMGEMINVSRLSDWVCEFCEDEFKSSDSLHHHKNEKHSIKEECVGDAEDSIDIAEHINICPTSEWICEFCEDEFKSTEDLLRHKNEKHHNETVYIKNADMSDDCNPLPAENELKDSIDVKEENLSNFAHTSRTTRKKIKTRCDICNITIRDQELMELHLKFHQPRSMGCCYCSSNLDSPYDLYVHKKTVHRMWSNVQMKWFCTRCETIIGDPRSARRHVTQCPKRMFQCQYCNQEYVNKKELISHQKKNHYEIMINDPNVAKFKCEFCDKTYVDRQVYMDHSRKHRAMLDEKYKCIYCEKIWPSSVSLKHHIQKTHDRQRIFKCDICSEEFYNENHMKIHEQGHSKCTCTECDRQFDDLQTLDQHLVKDHNIKIAKREEFSCKLCPASFSKERFLRDHQNTHTGKRPYVCKTCRKTFRTYSAHYAHVQGHKNSGFYCDYCKKKFSTKDVLKKHITKHQPPEDWRYYCEICNVKFRNHGILQWHMEKYESTHVRTCDVCGLEVLGIHKLGKHKSQKHDIR